MKFWKKADATGSSNTFNPATVTVHLAHILSDPTVVSHCPFCGSGDIIAGGDQTISCDFCNRSFVVMEQPQYPAMPGDPNAKPPGQMPGAQDPAMPGADPAVEQPGTPVNPQTDPEALAAAPPFKLAVQRKMYRTAKGATLDEDDFVKHVAFLHGREYMLER